MPHLGQLSKPLSLALRDPAHLCSLGHPAPFCSLYSDHTQLSASLTQPLWSCLPVSSLKSDFSHLCFPLPRLCCSPKPSLGLSFLICQIGLLWG